MVTALPFGIGTKAAPSGSVPLPFGIKSAAPIAPDFSSKPAAAPTPTPITPPAKPAFTPPSVLGGSEISAAPLPNVIPFWDQDKSAVAKPISELPFYLRPGRVLSDTIRGAISDAADQAVKTSYSLMGLTGKTNPDGTMQKDILPADHQQVVRAANILTMGTAALNVALSPLGGIAQGAEKIPGVSLVAKLVNTVFTDAGKVSSFVGHSIVNHLPISQDSKDAIRPAIEGFFGLLGQVVLGKVAHDVAAPKLDEYTKKIAVESQSEATRIKVNTPPKTEVPVTSKTPGETPVQINKAYTPEEHLPVIDFGKPAVKTTAPGSAEGEVISLPNSEQSTKTYAELAAEAAKNAPKEAVPAETTPAEVAKPAPESTKAPVTDTTVKTPAESASELPVKSPIEAPGAIPLKPGEINVRTAASAADVSQKMAESGFNQLPEEEKAKYSPTTKAEQIGKVSNLMAKSFDDARAMIRGEKPVPTDIQGQVLFNAMEKFATDNRRGDILTELAKSPIASELSRSAQSLVSHGFNDNAHSAVEAVREITKARESNYAKKSKVTVQQAKTDIVKTEGAKLDNAIKAARSTRPTWEEFVKEISCQS